MKKFISLMMVVILSFTTLAVTSCGKKEDPRIDPNRTQLYVGLKESGLGRAWIDDIIVDYEKTRPDVQVLLDVKNEEYNSDKVLANIKYGREDVYLLNQSAYYDFVSLNGGSEYLADLSDIVLEGGENSLYSRAKKEIFDFYNVGKDGEVEVYGVPWSEANWCLVYDKDLFASKDLYNLDGYEGLDCIVGTKDDFYGPDGKFGTFDDGLPATWADFKILINDMVAQNIIPFTWTGKWADYRANIVSAILASYEGASDYELRYHFNGTHSTLGKIDETNGYKLVDSEGMKAALTVAKYITSNTKFYSSKTTNVTLDHGQAQLEFLSSCRTDTPIAFLLEATWWEYEAMGIFKDMRSKYGEGYGYGERNLGMFPFPKFLGGEDGIANQINDKITFASTISTNPGMICINKNSDVLDIAIDFFKFLTSASSHAYYTSQTGNTAPYDYEMSSEQLKGLTSFQKDMFAMRESEDVEFVRGSTKNKLFLYSGSYFDSWKLATNIDDTIYNDPLRAFQKSANLTVEKYIAGIKKIYNSQTWQEMYDRVY